jgi:DNA-binding beta-propeller fold protein YncE
MSDAGINAVATEINGLSDIKGAIIPNLSDNKQDNLEMKDLRKNKNFKEDNQQQGGVDDQVEETQEKKEQETRQGENNTDKETRGGGEREEKMEYRVRRLEERQSTLEWCCCVVIAVLVVVIAILASVVHCVYKMNHQSTPTDSPVNLYKIGKVQKVAVAGETATALLRIVVEGHDYTLGTKIMKCKNFTCRLVSSDGEVNCTVKRRQNECEIVYTPTTPGKHELHITVDGKHVQGSPANVTVIKNYKVPIDTVPTTLGLSGPQGIAFTQKGDMIVAEYKGHCCRIIAPSGKNTSEWESLTIIGSNGREKGKFEHPTGVAVDSEGYILVVDHKNHRIQKFDRSSRKVLLTVGIGQDIKSPELTSPVGIGIHPHTKMIYITTENKNNSIQILHPNLTYYKGFGSASEISKESKDDRAGNVSEENKGKFNQPKDVAFDSAGNVYIADNENHRIQVFTKEGEYLRMFGDKSYLEYPTGISIDSNDVVYVSILYMRRVVIFTSEGENVKKFGSDEKEPGQFTEPRGIEVKDGKIYVSDYTNNRIQVF